MRQGACQMNSVDKMSAHVELRNNDSRKQKPEVFTIRPRFLLQYFRFIQLS